jgi:DNA polymerase I-like protein with 3'-5' exonuclease and polymerase domains
LWPYGCDTGRNRPPGSEFIFGANSLFRGLIQPAPGRSLAYVDWERQEFGVAAYLSDDPAMIAGYQTDDPYVATGIAIGIIPPGGTGRSHPKERAICKQIVLGTQYGMGARTLAEKIDRTESHARELLRLHRRTYPKYWAWSDAIVRYAMIYGDLPTSFGWRLHVRPDTGPTTLRNFPMQSNGADMLRLACCLATGRGVTINATVHDAALIEASDGEIGEAVATMQAAMDEASSLVLDGPTLRTAVKVVTWPGRLLDDADRPTWDRMMSQLPAAGRVDVG